MRELTREIFNTDDDDTDGSTTTTTGWTTTTWLTVYGDDEDYVSSMSGDSTESEGLRKGARL